MDFFKWILALPLSIFIATQMAYGGPEIYSCISALAEKELSKGALSNESIILGLISKGYNDRIISDKDISKMVKSLQRGETIHPFHLERGLAQPELVRLGNRLDSLFEERLNLQFLVEKLKEIYNTSQLDQFTQIEKNRTFPAVKKAKFAPIQFADTSSDQIELMREPLTNWQWTMIMKYLNQRAHNIDYENDDKPEHKQYQFEIEGIKYLDHPNRPVSGINWMEILGGVSKSKLTVDGAPRQPITLNGQQLSKELIASSEPLLSDNYNKYLTELAKNWQTPSENESLYSEGLIQRINRWAKENHPQLTQVFPDHKPGDYYRLPSKKEWMWFLSEGHRIKNISSVLNNVSELVTSSITPPVGRYHQIKRFGSVFSDTKGSVRILLDNHPDTPSWLNPSLDWINGGPISRLSVTPSGINDDFLNLVPFPYGSGSFSGNLGVRLIRVRPSDN